MTQNTESPDTPERFTPDQPGSGGEVCVNACGCLRSQPTLAVSQQCDCGALVTSGGAAERALGNGEAVVGGLGATGGHAARRAWSRQDAALSGTYSVHGRH